MLPSSTTIHFLLLIVFTSYSFSHEHGNNCLSPHKQIENVYKDELDNDKVNLKERNEFVYQLVKFTKPQVILGWQISGKEGMLNATGRDRRGVVTEYIVKFLQRSGQWAHINNSHTGKEIFKTLGNLAQPTVITKVDLANPVTTTALRFYPQLWDGIPYFTLTLNLCYPEFMEKHKKHKDSDKGRSPPQAKHHPPKHNNHQQPPPHRTDNKHENNHKHDKGKESDNHHKNDKGKESDNHHKNDKGKEKDNHHKNDKGKEKDNHHKNDKGKEKDNHHKNDKGKKKDNHHKNSGTHPRTNHNHRKPRPEDLTKHLQHQLKSKKEKKIKSVKRNTDVDKTSAANDKPETHEKNSREAEEKQVDTAANLKEIKTKKRQGSAITPEHDHRTTTPEHDHRTTTPEHGHRTTTPEHDHRTTTLAPIITVGPNSKKVSKREHTCKDTQQWRYSKNHTPPKDDFSAVGDAHQAWRAMGSLNMEPFLFNLKAKNKHKKAIKKIFLQVAFKNLSKIYKIKIGGKGLSTDWGCVTKFAVLYKMERYMDWVFYRDEHGAAKIFNMGKKSKTSCGAEQTFQLPIPIVTSDIRIYPEKWSGKPYIHVNFLSCTVEGVSCVHPLLAGGKLQRIQFGNMDTKLQHKNTAYFISIKLNPDGKRMRVKAVRFQVGPIGNSVKKFVLQYHDEDEKPHSINDKNDQIVVYSTNDIVHKNKPMTVFFDKHVTTKSIRVYPQVWKGAAPSLKIDFLGCKE